MRAHINSLLVLLNKLDKGSEEERSQTKTNILSLIAIVGDLDFSSNNLMRNDLASFYNRLFRSVNSPFKEKCHQMVFDAWLAAKCIVLEDDSEYFIFELKRCFSPSLKKYIESFSVVEKLEWIRDSEKSFLLQLIDYRLDREEGVSGTRNLLEDRIKKLKKREEKALASLQNSPSSPVAFINSFRLFSSPQPKSDSGNEIEMVSPQEENGFPLPQKGDADEVEMMLKDKGVVSPRL